MASAHCSHPHLRSLRVRQQDPWTDGWRGWRLWTLSCPVFGTSPFWNHGHVRDRNGLLIVDDWHQSAQLASYWRRHFDLPEKISILTTSTIRMICPSQLRWLHLWPTDPNLLPGSPSSLGCYTASWARTLKVMIPSFDHALTVASSASSGSAPLTSDSLNHGGLAFLSRAIWQTWRTCLLNEVLRLLNFATVTALRTQVSSWVARLLIMCKWLAFWSVRSVSSLGIFRKSPAAAGRVCELPEEM